jgi:predicted Rossmann fold nucleotide-binding protein DprA/Smf involved in DNA uptake
MTRPADSELVAMLLAQRLVETEAPPLKAVEFWAVVDCVPDLGVLLGLRPEQISETAHVDESLAQRIGTLLAAATAFAFALDDAQQSGLKLLSGVSEHFPVVMKERLGRSAPPLLYLFGDAGLLGHSALAIVGSRAVSEGGSQIAREAALAAAKEGLAVISGGAKGVDRLAMYAAIGAGGRVVGVLADSLARTARDSDVRRAINDDQLCLCSPYRPTTGFTVANAMGRNKLIYAMSTATLVVECDEGSGGTWAGAVEALRDHTSPVIAWTGAGASPGNLALARRGAHRLGLVEELFPLPGGEVVPTRTQLRLDY